MAKPCENLLHCVVPVGPPVLRLSIPNHGCAGDLNWDESPETMSGTAGRVKIPFSYSTRNFSTTIADYLDLFGQETEGSPYPDQVIEVPDSVDIPPTAFKHVSNWIELQVGEPGEMRENREFRSVEWCQRLMLLEPGAHRALSWHRLGTISDVYRAADYLGVQPLVEIFGALLKYCSSRRRSSLTELQKEIEEFRNRTRGVWDAVSLPVIDLDTGRPVLGWSCYCVYVMYLKII